MSWLYGTCAKIKYREVKTNGRMDYPPHCSCRNCYSVVRCDEKERLEFQLAWWPGSGEGEEVRDD